MKTTQATVRLANPAAVLEALLGHMTEHDVEISRNDGTAVARIRSGEAKLHAGERALSLEASAPSLSQLENLAAFLASHVLEFAHPQMPVIEWSGLKAGDRFSDFREIEATGVTDLTPHMRRIRFKGDDLARFATNDDLHVRLFFPPPGQEPLWPVRGTDGLAKDVAPERKPAARKYTIRRIDAGTGTLDIDFVLHEASGPGGDWAKTAVPGARIGMAGPGGRSARTADWMLLAGDETAMPAIARILEDLPDATGGLAILSVETAHEALALRHPPAFEIRWLVRQSNSQDFAAAVMGAEIPQSGTRFCWAGAEFQDIQSIRRHWRGIGLTSDEQLAVAYWRRGEAGT